MTPQDLLRHSDTGELWAEDGGAAFADVSSAYRSAQEVRALRIARGEAPRGYKVGDTGVRRLDLNDILVRHQQCSDRGWSPPGSFGAPEPQEPGASQRSVLWAGNRPVG
jgi:hypothetical protein